MSRKPDYRVRALDKRIGLKGTIGAAWRNEDGSISIVLDNFVSLTQDGQLLITLFDAKQKEDA